MKLPKELIGINRVFRGEVVIVEGVDPQNAFCEDNCHNVFDIGSAQHEACLDSCRD